MDSKCICRSCNGIADLPDAIGDADLPDAIGDVDIHDATGPRRIAAASADFSICSGEATNVLQVEGRREPWECCGPQCGAVPCATSSVRHLSRNLLVADGVVLLPSCAKGDAPTEAPPFQCLALDLASNYGSVDGLEFGPSAEAQEDAAEAQEDAADALEALPVSQDTELAAAAAKRAAEWGAAATLAPTRATA
jgi:hypothetical protein